MQRTNKYGAKPRRVDGIYFHSTREAMRYRELQLLVKAGAIKDLTLQPRFELWVPKAGCDTNVSVGHYKADFGYTDTKTNERVIEDVKVPATRTTVYKLKKRIVEAFYGIRIIEV